MHRVAAAIVGAGIALGLGGCGSAPRGETPRAEPAEPAPAYAEVADAYNKRADALVSLWARSVIRFWYPDREGEERTEQVEGHFQYRHPRDVNLSLMKVSETVATLGSNATHYWWIELGRGEDRKAHIGEHSKATPERVAELGLPVYPLDLVDLVGITRIPTDLPTAGPESPSVRWGQGRSELVVSFPIEGGVRRVIMDPQTYEPLRIEIADEQGVLMLRSELSRYTAVRGGQAGAGPIRVPGEVLATVNEGRTRVRLRLYDPETGGNRPRPAAFDLQRLLEAYGVRNIINLDEQPVAVR